MTPAAVVDPWGRLTPRTCGLALVTLKLAGICCVREVGGNGCRRTCPQWPSEAATYHRDVLARVRNDAFGRSATPADLPQGIAAGAVFDGTGRVRMVLTVLAMPNRKPQEEIDRIGRAVRDSAAAISARTGGVPPTAV
jgi:hypothetical protein